MCVDLNAGACRRYPRKSTFVIQNMVCKRKKSDSGTWTSRPRGSRHGAFNDLSSKRRRIVGDVIECRARHRPHINTDWAWVCLQKTFDMSLIFVSNNEIEVSSF